MNKRNVQQVLQRSLIFVKKPYQIKNDNTTKVTVKRGAHFFNVDRVTRCFKEKIASFLVKVAKFVATVILSFFKTQNIYIKAVLKCRNTYIKGYNKIENIYLKTQILSCYLGEKLKICPQTKISKFVTKFLAIFGRKKSPKRSQNCQNGDKSPYLVTLNADFIF